MKINLVIVPHFDDEILQAGAIILKSKIPTTVIFTHWYDNNETKYGELESMLESVGMLETYTHTPITKGRTNPSKGENWYKSCLSFIESIVGKYEIDTLMYTLPSGHQSHNESNAIVSSLLRAPYLFQIHKILKAPYPLSYFAPVNHSSEDKDYNTFLTLTEDQVQVLIDILKGPYGYKCKGNGLYSEKVFEQALRFFGISAGAEFAMPYIMSRFVE